MNEFFSHFIDNEHWGIYSVLTFILAISRLRIEFSAVVFVYCLSLFTIFTSLGFGEHKNIASVMWDISAHACEFNNINLPKSWCLKYAISPSHNAKHVKTLWWCKYFWPYVTTTSCSAQKLDAVFLVWPPHHIPNSTDTTTSLTIWFTTYYLFEKPFACTAPFNRTITVWLSSVQLR